MEFALPAAVTEVLNTLARRGYEAHIVGGSVRDLLLGRTPKDFDVCNCVRALIGE